jgi:hypothetical protein
MVRLLGRISDKRIFFEDSKTIFDHGTTAILAVTSTTIATAFKSVIFAWVNTRMTNQPVASCCWVKGTGGANIEIGATAGVTATVDWFAIGYTA